MLNPQKIKKIVSPVVKNLNCFKIGKIVFPKPKGIKINMMPFIIGDKKSIPKEYQQYYLIIEKCLIDKDEIGKVGYLTIHERHVDKGESHRRGGIHTEKHGKDMAWGGPWGKGKNLKGGLFMASNISDSCKIWNTHIENPEHMGDCEHLRGTLENEISIKENELYWLTDSCPHESLALEKSCYRQFFRYVTSEVSLWYDQYSTKNRLGVLPNCKIIYGSKF